MEDIFKITKDRERALDLLNMAIERSEMINIFPKDKTYRLVEEYYEIIKELLTSLMYVDGYKTLSHIALIDYFKKNYRELNDSQLTIVDNLRKFRNGVVYYGKKINESFLMNNQKEIEKIIKLLIKFVQKKISI